MEVKIIKENNPMAKVLLNPNEVLFAESGALVGMTSGVEIDMRVRGGQIKFMIDLPSKKETLFVNSYRAVGGYGEVLLAPSLPGDILSLELNREALLIQPSAYLASSEKVKLDPRWAGAKSIASGEGLYMFRCSGKGRLILSSCGGVHKVPLGREETYTSTRGHLLAMTSEVRYRLRQAGGVKANVFFGGGQVVELQGPGLVYLQTRSEEALAAWVKSQGSRI